MASVEWGIALNAESFPAVLGTGERLRIATTAAFLDIPPLSIYFTIDDANYCTLQSVRRAGLSRNGKRHS